MALSALLAVCLICSHPGPALLLSDFATCLEQNGIRTKVLSGDVAYETLVKGGRKTDPFPDNQSHSDLKELAQKVARAASSSKCVIIDVGHPLSTRVLRILSTDFPDIIRVAFYDNGQSLVEGGYSELTAPALRLSQIILFANKNLEDAPIYSAKDQPIDLSHQRRIGIGSSSLPSEMPRLKKLKETQSPENRAAFLAKLAIPDRGQKIVVYLGGANEVYEKEAFPHFLNLLNEIDQDGITFVLQPHPRGKKPNLEGTKLLYSTADFDLALLAADQLFYHQTSANLKFLLLGTPTSQIGAKKETNDLLVAGGFIESLTTKEELLRALGKSHHPIDPETETRAYAAFGIDPNWEEVLLKTVRPLLK